MRTGFIGWQMPESHAAMYETARCSFILPTEMLVRTRYVQLTLFHGKGRIVLYTV